MKLIINKSLNNYFNKIIINVNDNQVIRSTFSDDYCSINLNSYDKIVIKLRLLDNFRIKLISFIYMPGKDILYIGPTRLYKIWEIINFQLFPYLCIFLLVLKPTISYLNFQWIIVGIIIFTALSLFFMQLSKLIPYIRKKLFKIVWL